MDADILKVYRRLALRHFADDSRYYTIPSVDLSTLREGHIASYRLPNLCTAEMTTFLKETTNGTAT